MLLAEALCRTGREEEALAVLDAIPKYNPNFSVAHFETVTLAICRSQETVDQLCACCKKLLRERS